MRYISLFAGIGGFDLALESLGHECVYANDFDKHCKIIYDKHFKTKLDTRSISDVSSSEIPDHDLLVGGFPCQSFSVAGKRGGFEDTRGTLFFEIARILRDKRPRHFLLENVKGLLSHDNGKTFQTILRVLADLGYDAEWKVLNSRFFGVPQNRERVFITGHLRGESRPKVFPLTKSSTNDIKQLNDANRSNKAVQRVPLKFLNRNQRNIDGDSAYTVDSMNSGGVMISNMNMAGKSFEHDYAGTLRAGASSNYQTVNKIRRLTPTECERLQGFPDGWTEGVSDTQRYKQLGNAVTVNVVYEVAKLL